MGMGNHCHALAPYLCQGPNTHCIGGWMGLRAGLDGCGNPHLHWDMILDSPVRSKSLYWLRNPNPQHIWYVVLLKSEELHGSGAEFCDHIHLSPTGQNELCSLLLVYKLFLPQ